MEPIRKLSYTAGPWRRKDWSIYADHGETFRTICHTALNQRQRKNPLNMGDAALIADAPAMLLALEMVQRGKARIEAREFCFNGLRYSVSDNDWGRVIDAIGWEKCRASCIH